MMQHFYALENELADVERRSVQVHGAAFGAFAAAAEMFGVITKSEMGEFRNFLKAKCVSSSEQGIQAVNVNQFWVDMISAARRGVFGSTATELKRFFKARGTEVEHAPGAPAQARWKSYTFFIEINGVLDLMRKDLRQQGKVMALEKTDLREQMSRRPYWSMQNYSKGNRSAKQRFGDSPMNCWAIEVDKLDEFGYRAISDEGLTDSRHTKRPELPGADWPADGEWIDPRKGDLFTVIEQVERKTGEAE